MHGDPLILLLVRHAEAAGVGGAIRSDEERPLTARGIEDATAVGRALARLEHQEPMIVTSPLLRAVQTGKHIEEGMGSVVHRSTSRFLAPGISERDVYHELGVLHKAGQQSVLLVGHQPDIGSFLSFLVCGGVPASVSMPPGTVARLSVKASGLHPEAVLHWLLPPSAARTFTNPHS